MSCEWTTSELAYLREAAGRVPLREIQLHLRRSAESVRKQAQSQGLSLRVPAWRMEWCDECATWRMRLRKNGRCGVCQLRANIQREEERIAEALRSLPMERRLAFERGEAKKGRQKASAPPPVKRVPSDATPYERSRAEQEYLAAMERWQAERLQLRYDAAKQRLKDPDQYIGFAIWEEFNQFKGMRQVRKAEQSVKRGCAPHFWTFRMWNTHPDEEHWSNEHWRESVEDPDTYAIRVNYNEVPAEWLGEAFIADALKLKAANPEAYKNEYLGECSKLTGRVFANVEDFQCDQQAVNGFKWVKNGIDWGYMQDPFVFLRVAYDRKMGDLYVFDELFNTETLDQPNIDEVKRRLAERDSDGRPRLTAEGRLQFKKSKPSNEIRADAAAPKDIATWKEGGVWIMGASKRVPVEDGIRWLQKRAHIYIDRRRCPLAWAEFTRYRALEDEEGRFNGFPDKDNHTIDAVRYAVFDLIADRTIV